MSPPVETRKSRPVAAASAALLALTAVTFAVVRPTNFRGYDEWLIVSLLSQGILDFPYANRPLNLLWAMPGWLLSPDALRGFLVVHAAWIGLGGVLVFLIARRIRPRAPAFAFLAGAFTIVWAPSDATRLCAVQMALYSGCTFGVLLAVWLLVEAWYRRDRILAGAAAAVAAATLLSLEAALAPLALTPLLLLFAGGSREPRRWGAWTAVVVAFLAAGALRAVVPLRADPKHVAYQAEALAPDYDPARLARRTVGQLRHHLGPLADLPHAEHALPLAALAVAVFAAGLLASRRSGPAPEGAGAAPSLRGGLAAAAFGLLWAVASYLPFILSTKTRGPVRTEFLSAPGVAVLLAALAVGLSSLLPSRLRFVAAGLVGAWVVAVGTGRTVALQAEWDTASAYPAQRRALLELNAIAPDLAPGTLVVLLPHGRPWPFDFSFRHAVRYLYKGRAIGVAVGAEPLLYDTRFDADGVHADPDPVLRGPWREEAVAYPYESLVVLREDAEGRLRLLEAWPDDLFPLPPGASYAPRPRLRGGPGPRRLTILDPRS